MPPPLLSKHTRFVRVRGSMDNGGHRGVETQMVALPPSDRTDLDDGMMDGRFPQRSKPALHTFLLSSNPIEARGLALK